MPEWAQEEKQAGRSRGIGKGRGQRGLSPLPACSEPRNESEHCSEASMLGKRRITVFFQCFMVSFTKPSQSFVWSVYRPFWARVVIILSPCLQRRSLSHLLWPSEARLVFLSFLGLHSHAHISISPLQSGHGNVKKVCAQASKGREGHGAPKRFKLVKYSTT